MQMPEDVQDATLDDINRNKVTRFNHAALFRGSRIDARSGDLDSNQACIAALDPSAKHVLALLEGEAPRRAPKV